MPKLDNQLAAGLLRSPLHRVVSGWLLLLTYTGRRSGRTMTLPVAYAADGDSVVIIPGRPHTKAWWRNFVGGGPVEVVLAGRRRTGTATTVQEGTELAAAADRFRARFPRPAVRFMGQPVLAVVIDLDPA